MTNSITHVVFDLGGVIVELKGSPIKSEWFSNNKTMEEVWETWLVSEAPRAFESGAISATEFADRIVTELSLNVSASEFLQYFSGLPIGPFPGAKELLLAVKNTHTTALFSNSNEIHWQRKMNEMALGPLFNEHFASHLMGMVKPDTEAFEKVLAELGVPAQQVLFFDDNQMNVDAAQSVGMLAERVVGLEQLRAGLEKHNIVC